ncbi:MAG: chain length determinant protein EpsF [Rhodocyclaceae bacterium]|nr:chain length determinant protein EpsF [Rhodocyclaceae bacterium]
MNLQQFFLILLARWKIAAYTLGGTVATTLVVSLLWPNTYTASTAVVVDVKSPDPVAGMVLPALAMPGYMATQVDVITSDRVSQRVVKLLKLDQVPTIQEQWKGATDGKGSLEVWLGELLQKKLDVKPSRESNVININYKGSDPAFAAAIANAYAQAYIDTTIDLKVEPARQYAAWFDQQSKQLRDRLERAKGKLSEYQQAKGIVASDERLNYENQRLAELQSQLVVAETQEADSQSKQKSGGGDTLQDVMQNPVILQMKSDIARLEGKLQEMSGNLGKNHPQFKRAEAELASLREQMQAETRKISSSISTANRVSKEKQAELEAAIDAHKKRILDLKKERDEVSVMQQDVDSAQRAYEAINQRYNQSMLESNSTQTNVSVLTPASPPLEASSPKVLLNVVLSIFLGTLLGVGAALVLELLDRRVRSHDDLELTLELPVLADLAVPQDPSAGHPVVRFIRKRLARRGHAPAVA